jgi:hypothetical protein
MMNQILAWCSPNAPLSITDSDWLDFTADNAEQLQ